MHVLNPAAALAAPRITIYAARVVIAFGSMVLAGSMVPWITINAARMVILAALLHLLPSASAQSPPALKAGAEKPRKSMAVVVAFRDYPAAPNLGKLPRIVENSVALALELHASGYEVTLVTDSTRAGLDADLVNVKKPKLPAPADLKVVTLSTSVMLEAELGNWVAAVAKQRAPLALMFLSGHGVELAKVPHLLTPTDTPATGGVSLAAIKAKVAKESTTGLPIAIVWNACRSDASAAPGAAPPPVPVAPWPEKSGDFRWMELRARAAVVSTSLRKNGQAQEPTVYFSARSGKVASAEKDIIQYLAELLRDRKKLDEVMKLYRGGPAANELSLEDWLKFASGFVLDMNFRQEYEIVFDAVPAKYPIAVFAGGRWKGPDRVLLVDLMSSDWGALSGVDCDFAYSPRTGLTIKRQNQGLGLYALLPLEPGLGMEAGGSLTMDVVADAIDAMPNVPGKLWFSPNPFNSKPDAKMRPHNFFTGNLVQSNNDTVPLDIAYRIPKQLTLPLHPSADLKLDQIGWANTAQNVPAYKNLVWPMGATLSVIGMKLTPTATGPASPPNKPLNMGQLFPGSWEWKENDGFPGMDVCVVEPLKSGGYRLTPTVGEDTVPKKSRFGAAVRPAQYVPRHHAMEIEYRSTAEGTSLTIDLLFEDNSKNAAGEVTPYLDSHTVKLAKTDQFKKLEPIVIDKNAGFVNYLSLTASSPIEIKSIRIIEKK